MRKIVSLVISFVLCFSFALADTSANNHIPIKSITAEETNVEIALAPLGMSLFYKPDNLTDNLPPYMYKPVLTFTPSDASNQDLEWSSDNPLIADVAADGTIIGVTSGTASITGKATDGSGKSVKIKVKVLACYVTEDEVTITDPEGATLGYIYGTPNGINTFKIITKGNVVRVDPLGKSDGMYMIKLVPLKAGTGSLSFTLNGQTMKKVNITVKQSALK